MTTAQGDTIFIKNTDSLNVAIKKLVKQLNNSQSLPDGTIQGYELEEGSISFDKFSGFKKRTINYF